MAPSESDHFTEQKGKGKSEKKRRNILVPFSFTKSSLSQGRTSGAPMKIDLTIQWPIRFFTNPKEADKKMIGNKD